MSSWPETSDVQKAIFRALELLDSDSEYEYPHELRPNIDIGDVNSTDAQYLTLQSLPTSNSGSNTQHNITSVVGSEANEQAKAVFQNLNSKKCYRCSLCSYAKTTRAAILHHIKKEHADKSFHPQKCPDCPFLSLNEDSFRQHIRRCNQRFQCHCCTYSSTKFSNVTRHFKRKHAGMDIDTVHRHQITDKCKSM